MGASPYDTRSCPVRPRLAGFTFVCCAIANVAAGNSLGDGLSATTGGSADRGDARRIQMSLDRIIGRVGMKHRPRSSALIERLESRQLLSADPISVLIGAGAAKAVLFTDSNGTTATVSVKGPGSATVNFDGAGLGQIASARGVVVTGTGVAMTSI